MKQTCLGSFRFSYRSEKNYFPVIAEFAPGELYTDQYKVKAIDLVSRSRHKVNIDTLLSADCVDKSAYRLSVKFHRYANPTIDIVLSIKVKVERLLSTYLAITGT